MEYKPYIWMGEDADAHVRDFREIQRKFQEILELETTLVTPSAVYVRSASGALYNVAINADGNRLYWLNLDSVRFIPE